MANRRQKTPRQHTGPPPAGSRQGVDLISVLTSAALVAALFVALYSWQKTRSIEEILDERLESIERRNDEGGVAQGRPAQEQRRGPDPDRVYEIRTAGAPVRGSTSAPITIAEFSDFQ